MIRMICDRCGRTVDSTAYPYDCKVKILNREYDLCKHCMQKVKEFITTERIKTADYCDICNHKGCYNCTANNLDDYCVPSGYAPKDTPQTDCDTCRHYKLACELFSEVCKYEPITQTETQNSNNDAPQTDLSAEEFVEGMKNLKMEVKRTDCSWK